MLKSVLKTINDIGTDLRLQRREYAETVVVVLILVSLLRIFGAEAFEIPSGSMATTLLGAHKIGICPDCRYHSLINARSEIEPTKNPLTDRYELFEVKGGHCQNCGYPIEFGAGSKVTSGDRVLVSKFWYDGVSEPKRWHIPVFKCPERPNGSMNYIKRLVGLPNETIQIKYGHVYVAPPHSDQFEIARRPPNVELAVRRLVHDADFPPLRLRQGEGGIVRWSGEAGWQSDPDGKTWRYSGAGQGKLSYRHWIGRDRLGGSDQSSLITDIAAYNTDSVRGGASTAVAHANWVRDLMVECRLNVEAAAGAATFELGAGARRYRLRFDLQSGEASLWQGDRLLTKAATQVNAVGERSIRFCDFDERLTVWIDDRLVFGDGFELQPSTADEMGPFLSDFVPVVIASDRAAVGIRSLKVFRNTYYLKTASEADVPFVTNVEPTRESVDRFRANLARAMASPRVLEVADNSYLMMGDNSSNSSDGRDWTTTHFVPRQNLLGRALSVYWPLNNVHFCR